MRFKTINLAAFGSFTDQQLDFPAQPDFHIIYGPNEAGKSTTLRALINGLYGIPLRSSDNHLHDNRQLKIGVELENNSESLSFIRQKRKASMLDPHTGQEIDEKKLDQFLANINQNSYENMFGLDHERLRSGGKALVTDSGDLGFSIFSAATGIGKMQEIVAKLEAKSRELYVNRKNSTSSLYITIDKYKQKLQDADKLYLRGREWQELEKAYLNGQRELQQLKETIDTLKQQLRKYQRITRCAPVLSKLDTVKQHLNELGDVVVLDARVSEQRQETESKLILAQADLGRSQIKLTEVTKELEQIVIPEHLIASSDEINVLIEQIGNYRAKRDNIPTLSAGLMRLETESLAMLRQIDPAAQDLNAIEDYRLSLVTSATLRSLIGQYNKLNDQLGPVVDAIAELEEDLADLNNKISKLQGVTEPDALKQLVKGVRSDGQLEQSLVKNHFDKKKLEQQINHEIKQLGFWSGTYQELVDLAVPAIEETRLFNKRITEKRGQITTFNDQLKEYKDQIQEQTNSLALLDGMHRIPTIEELTKFRKKRDHGWSLIKQAWLSGSVNQEEEQAYTQGKPLADVYEQKVAKADQTVDFMYSQAQTVGEKQAWLKQVADWEQRHGELNELLKDESQALVDIITQWNNLWDKTCIKPTEPEQMLTWLEKRQALLNKIGDLEQLIIGGDELESKINNHLDALNKELQASGYRHNSEETLAATVEYADGIVAKADQQLAKLISYQETEKHTKERLTKQKQHLANIEAALAKVNGQLQDQLQAANLAIDINPDALVAYLDQITELFNKINQLRKDQATLNEHREYLMRYANQVEQLIKDYAPEFQDQTADVGIQRLNERLQKAQQDVAIKNQLVKQTTEQKAAISQAQEVITTANKILAGLMQQAQVSDLAALKKAELRSEDYATLQNQKAELEENLLFEGAGRTLEEIDAEVNEVDLDALPGIIADLEQQLQENVRIENEQLQEFGGIKDRYHKQVQGTSIAAVGTKQEAEGLLSSAKEQAAEYIEVQTTLFLLRRAIEKYRQQNQGPILNLASGIFSQLTLGSFSGLMADTDDKGNPFILAVRPEGKELDVTALSDGTLDQLYLALRLATIEDHIRTSQPLPLICDDVLINFDDYRSLATLEVLAKLAKKTQIIYFTHHSQVVEIAKKHLPQQVNILYLGGPPVGRDV